MSFLDEYQEEVEKEKQNFKVINQKINLLASNILDKAIEDYKAGKLRVQDVTDFEKINRIINDSMQRSKEIGDENGTLPALDSGQEHIIENSVKVTTSTKTDDKGNIIQENKINLSDLANASQKDLKSMDKREQQMNNDNAKETL